MRKCPSLSLTTKQIQYFARKTVSELGAKSRQFSEERRILKMRINEKLRQIADSRVRIDSSNRQTCKLFFYDAGFYNQYSDVRKQELGRKWEELKNKREERVRKLLNDCCKKKNIPDMYEGVISDDKNLISKFGNEISLEKIALSHDGELVSIYQMGFILRYIFSFGCWHSTFKRLSGLMMEQDAFTRIVSCTSMLANLTNLFIGVGKGYILYTVKGECGFKGTIMACPWGVI